MIVSLGPPGRQAAVRRGGAAFRGRVSAERSQRGRRPARLLAVLLAWSFLSAAAAAPDGLPGSPVYSRAELVEEIGGTVEWRWRSVVHLELPQPDCERGAFRCRRDAVYGQLIGFSFRQEVEREPATGERGESAARGRLLIAADLDPEDALALEDALLSHLRALTAPDFARPFAGMAFPREPLSAEAFASSALPVWICRVTGDETVADILVFGERRNRFFSRPGPLAAEACGVMAEAVSEAAPRTIRTGRLARVVRRRDVTLEEGSSLEAAFWSDALAELPGAIAFGKREVGDRPTGSILDWKGRTLVAREGRYHGVERTLRAGPAALDLAGRPLWAARWRFETRLERFGAHPSADAVEVSSLLVAAVPIRDPLMDRETASRTPLWVPARELVDRAVRRIDSAAAPGPRQVLEALADPSLWPAAGDWLLVACREDGTARYAIAPAAPEVEVENAGEVCAAAEEVLAPAGR